MFLVPREYDFMYAVFSEYFCAGDQNKPTKKRSYKNLTARSYAQD